MRNPIVTRPTMFARDSLARRTHETPAIEPVRNVPRIDLVTAPEPTRRHGKHPSVDATSARQRSDTWALAGLILCGLAFAGAFVAFVLYPAMQTLVK